MRVYILRELTTKSLYNVLHYCLRFYGYLVAWHIFIAYLHTSFIASPCFFFSRLQLAQKIVLWYFVYIFRHEVRYTFNYMEHRVPSRTKLSSNPLSLRRAIISCFLRIHRDCSLLDNLPHPSSKDAHVHSETTKFLQK